VDATTESTSVVRDIEIAASPETVWELLTDQNEATRWMGQAAEFDLRPGGIHRVEVIPGNTARGEFVEIEAPHRLVYTWGWETGGSADSLPAGSSTVEFELEPKGAGTLLHFRHTDLPSAESAASHTQGWDHYLARLATVAAGGDAGVDPWTTGEMS
jgi:uncharacterized protein YndB with AHSA1/START domain